MIQKYMICKVNIGTLPSHQTDDFMKLLMEQMKEPQLFTRQYFIPTQEQSSIHFITINTETGVIYTTTTRDEILTLNDMKLLEYFDEFKSTYTEGKQ